MGKMNTGYSSFSSGPEHTQAIPTLDHTPTIPTQYGIPSMSTDSLGVDSNDPRIPEGHEGPEEHYGMNPRKGQMREGQTAREYTNLMRENWKRQIAESASKKKSASDEVPSDSDMSMAEDGPFQKLEGKLSHEKGVHDPAALAASIGRKKLGGKEYDHRISEGERHKG